MEQIFIFLIWYFYIAVIGLIFFPLTSLIFKKFNFDLGYPFGKTLAIIFLSYFIFVLGSFKIISFNQLNLLFLLIIFFLINLFIFKKNKLEFSSFSKNLIFEEFLFFIAFSFWTYVRSHEPSIRTLEKFMDFGFINSILRSNFFPPIDIWYPPEPINYYYFGHLTGAVLIKLINIPPSIGYNLILSTLFALGISQIFSLTANLITFFDKKINKVFLILISFLTTFIVNLGGNLHTIYVLTKGYPNENPIPFWKIFSFCNSLFPSICQELREQLYPYWYPNATRFIPYTIHEFPSYSYVVADLHGHVFDIPFVILTIAFLFITFLYLKERVDKKKEIFLIIFLGFLTAIHYMTNAFDGPIYLLLTLTIFLITYNFSFSFFFKVLIIFLSFFIFSYPFSFKFKPFVTGIGINCGAEILNFTGEIGPFLFEKNNCQSSPFWMLLLLWGFFLVSFLFFLLIVKKFNNQKEISFNQKILSFFILILFSYGSFLVIIPEYFYIKDIYPVHFRANTMFKLGYQAFIMMGIASGLTFFLISYYKRRLFIFIYLILFIFVFIYPFYAIPSYYGSLKKPISLDGSFWLYQYYPEDKEIIDWLNKNIKNQLIILEAQGDSYTDYERISVMTGLPTVAGWWVHEWLWRGSADFIGKRIPEVVNIYESKDIRLTKKLLKKYNVSYVIISQLERQKYKNLNEEKFKKIGRIIFQSSNKKGLIYQIK